MSEHLQINNLYFKYDYDLVLENINILVNKGSFVTIIGPNGSGKSTLLKAISKVILPNKGQILFDNLDIAVLNQKLLAQNMAVVPQNINIDFPFTVFDTVLMGRTPFLRKFESEGKKDHAIATWAMELTNTLHLKDRKVTEISGGELQRVLVARALTQEPKMILLDEPTAHLDISHQIELLELLQSLNTTTGLTVIAVLHDLNLAAQFSDYIFLLKDGQVVVSGEPEKVLTTENIRKVYKMEVSITDNLLTGRFNIIPLTKTTNKINGKGLHVHLICGGGTGLFLFDKLAFLGYKVTCGVLNIGDSDWSKAKKLGLNIAEEAPFAPISKKAALKNEELIMQANCIIVTPVPFGPGNLINLELALDACKKNQPVLVIQHTDSKQEDFTNGAAKKLLNDIQNAGGKFINNPQEIFDFLEHIRN
ncbi:MAG: ABC transporter ATP-binding protein [Peptococcales bacterium]|jgi:iron complex transport system ATP-binding protein